MFAFACYEFRVLFLYFFEQDFSDFNMAVTHSLKRNVNKTTVKTKKKKQFDEFVFKSLENMTKQKINKE